MTLKLNIGDSKTGKTTQKELSEDFSKGLIGKKIGDKISGNDVGFPGYEFTITGGSDSAGFPMRRDVTGTARKRILITKGVGFKTNRKGLRRRITVAGNTVYAKTAQLNVRIDKHGKDPLDGPAEKPAAEAPAEGDAPAEAAEAQESPAEEAKTEEAAPAEKESAEESKAEEEPKEE